MRARARALGDPQTSFGGRLRGMGGRHSLPRVKVVAPHFCACPRNTTAYSGVKSGKGWGVEGVRYMMSSVVGQIHLAVRGWRDSQL